MYAAKTMISAAATIFLAMGTVHASSTPPITSNDCTQLSFVTAYNCDRIDPALNNNTLTAAGWQCCWHEGPFAPPPDGVIFAWLKVNDQGVVIDRCLTNGTCTDVEDMSSKERDKDNTTIDKANSPEGPSKYGRRNAC